MLFVRRRYPPGISGTGFRERLTHFGDALRVSVRSGGMGGAPDPGDSAVDEEKRLCYCLGGKDLRRRYDLLDIFLLTDNIRTFRLDRSCNDICVEALERRSGIVLWMRPDCQTGNTHLPIYGSTLLRRVPSDERRATLEVDG